MVVFPKPGVCRVTLGPVSFVAMGAVIALGLVSSPATGGGAEGSAAGRPVWAGQPGPAAGGSAGPGRMDPRKRAYTDACDRGNARFASRDFDAAIASYRAAIAQSVHEPLGYYLLGEAELAIGNLADAEAAWQRALSESEQDVDLRARTLFVLADLRERQGRWDEAKIAWQAYLDWLANAKASGFAASARSRQEAIDRMRRQDRTYDVVRQRIRETSDGGVFSTVSTEPPTP
ncbi:MAG TPA: tetratricopeptide repeat protein [Polyangiaceae bacterium]|nr:tetratricopeptide repeat protein [Polyangiaceae bacterium]